MSAKLRRDALSIFRAALTAADAAVAVREHLALVRGQLRVGNVRLSGNARKTGTAAAQVPSVASLYGGADSVPFALSMKNFDRVFVIGAGKAAVPMTRAIEEIVGSRLAEGIVVTKHGHTGSPGRGLQVIEAGHPIPDAAGMRASVAIRDLMSELNARDLLLIAISGGASALLSAPVEPVTLQAKQKTTDLLLRAGADIFELNTVRKHLSFLKGGRLAALAYPATVVTLLLSDVIGDPSDVIGSGPTVPDSSTFADAIAVLSKFNLLRRVPESVRARLEQGRRGEIPETPKPGDPLFENVHNLVIGSNHLALSAAARKAKALGYKPLILSSTMQGEARDAARILAQILREVVASGNPIAVPACILAGGETTVTVRGNGKGGRNQEFALAAATSVAGLPRVLVLSAGTDGSDGPTDAAGAVVTGDTLERARRMKLSAEEYLLRNDSYSFFATLGDLVKTGPTGTNVMDVHILLAG